MDLYLYFIFCHNKWHCFWNFLLKLSIVNIYLCISLVFCGDLYNFFALWGVWTQSLLWARWVLSRSFRARPLYNSYIGFKTPFFAVDSLRFVPGQSSHLGIGTVLFILFLNYVCYFIFLFYCIGVIPIWWGGMANIKKASFFDLQSYAKNVYLVFYS